MILATKSRKAPRRRLAVSFAIGIPAHVLVGFEHGGLCFQEGATYLVVEITEEEVCFTQERRMTHTELDEHIKAGHIALGI